jgi:hypothetical protein
MILPFVFYIRRSLLETEEFLARKVRPTFRRACIRWRATGR